MKQTLYSVRTHVTESATPQYYITKFVDGEVESSYETSQFECACPAGQRPSCRHRQMLPQMLAAGIVNTHWFWDFDLGRVVDFEGQLKSNLDALNELANPSPERIEAESATASSPVLESTSPFEGEILPPIQQIPPGDYTAEIDKLKLYPDGMVGMSFKNIKPWRRM